MFAGQAYRFEQGVGLRGHAWMVSSGSRSLGEIPLLRDESEEAFTERATDFVRLCRVYETIAERVPITPANWDRRQLGQRPPPEGTG